MSKRWPKNRDAAARLRTMQVVTLLYEIVANKMVSGGKVRWEQTPEMIVLIEAAARLQQYAFAAMKEAHSRAAQEAAGDTR